MSIDAPVHVAGRNLSLVWAEALLHVFDGAASRRPPLVVSIGGFGAAPEEDVELRSAVEAALDATNRNRIDSTALTIFPYKPWVRKGRPPYRDYRSFCIERLLPRLKTLDQRNRNGTYFQRMMAYTGYHRGGESCVDQLGEIIELLRDSRRWRESALQIACFDPAKDHTGQPVKGFPCLQQVGLSYGDDNDFALNAFYPTQYIFDRAYGNYLGLCHLGLLLAHESGRSFRRLNCFIGKPELGDVNKGDVRTLAALCRRKIESP